MISFSDGKSITFLRISLDLPTFICPLTLFIWKRSNGYSSLTKINFPIYNSTVFLARDIACLSPHTHIQYALIRWRHMHKEIFGLDLLFCTQRADCQRRWWYVLYVKGKEENNIYLIDIASSSFDGIFLFLSLAIYRWWCLNTISIFVISTVVMGRCARRYMHMQSCIGSL